MKGSIYTTQKCYECGKNLKYVEGNGILQCKEHPQYIWTKDCRVKFDQEHIKRFPTVLDAEKHLTYLRSQTDHGAYDARDWLESKPLSFRSQREGFVLSKKKDNVGPKQIRHITLPSLIPTMIILTLLGIGRIFYGNFGLFYTVTLQKCFSTLKSTTAIIDTYVFNVFMYIGDVGMSTAAGLFQSVVGLVMIVSCNKLVKMYERDYALF